MERGRQKKAGSQPPFRERKGNSKKVLEGGGGAGEGRKAERITQFITETQSGKNPNVGVRTTSRSHFPYRREIEGEKKFI